MRDRLYTTEAIILRRSEVGEADRLLTIYTPNYGKLRVAARGVRKITSKLAGHLELFIHTKLQLAKGRNVDVVTESRVVQPFRHVREDLDRISVAYYFCELLDQMTPDSSESPALFRLVRDCLAALDAIDDQQRRDVLMRYFELHILTLSGYRPHLFHCAVCEQELAQDAERYSPYTGGVICPNCTPSEPHALPMTFNSFKVLRYLARAPLDDVLNLAPHATTLRETAFLLKASLRQILERELKSVTFLNELRS
ncbi:MAG: DNA repair protein RecO [Herpetosiphon sp.]|nr:DNA repair protein RecO [Herpetosiphon sp.]